MATSTRAQRVAAVGCLALVAASCGAQPAVSPGAPTPIAPTTVAGPTAPTPIAGPTAPTTVAGPTAPSAPTTVAGPAECSTGQLQVTLGPAEGAAGTVYRPLRFTNIGKEPCALIGFPGVSYVAGDDGHQVGPAAQREGDLGATVTLAAGAVASAELALVNVQNYGQADCHPTPTRGLRIYPPDQTIAVFVAVEGTGCAIQPAGPQLRVSAIRPGPGGR